MQRNVFHGKGTKFVYNKTVDVAYQTSASEHFRKAQKNHFNLMNAFNLHIAISNSLDDKATGLGIINVTENL